MKSRRLFVLVAFPAGLLLAACAPSQAQLDAAATQVAAQIFATQTAQAPTPTPTFTPSPTATPTPTPTATATAPPTPTPTLTITPTSTPRLLAAGLTLDDFPAGYEPMPAEQLRSLEESLPSGAVAFGFTNSLRGHGIMGYLYPVSTQAEQAAFDRGLPGMVELSATGAAADAKGKPLGGLNDVGDARAGLTFTTKISGFAVRWEIVGFRRQEIGGLVIAFYGDGGDPPLPTGDLVRLVDKRMGAFLSGGPQMVLFHDDFSNSSSGWGTGTDDTGSLDYESGEYVFKITKEKWFTWGNLDEETFSNVRIEVEVQNKSGHDEPTFGIICGYQDEQNFYYAGFGSDGYYAIVRTQDNEDLVLTDAADNQWVHSDDITTGKEKYDLALECANGELKLVVDGKTIASVQDETFTSGQIGLFVLTFDRPDAEVSFDDFVVKSLK